jgi:hypothetical protein
MYIIVLKGEFIEFATGEDVGLLDYTCRGEKGSVHVGLVYRSGQRKRSERKRSAARAAVSQLVSHLGVLLFLSGNHGRPALPAPHALARRRGRSGVSSSKQRAQSSGTRDDVCMYVRAYIYKHNQCLAYLGRQARRQARRQKACTARRCRG